MKQSIPTSTQPLGSCKPPSSAVTRPRVTSKRLPQTLADVEALMHTVAQADAALEQVRLHLPEYIRTAEEIDKTSILNAVAGGQLTTTQLEAVGLKITQTERFYVEPKTEEETTK